MSKTILQLENISKTFGKGEAEVKALVDVNLQVHAGELLALVGPSGSGKSTMLSIAGALLTPSEGRIHLDGDDITDLGDAERTKLRLNRMGFIFQGSNLVSFLSGRDQLLFLAKMQGTSSDDAEKRADSLLESLGMGKRAKHYPEEMSGGERQRIAIARALMNDPDLILADEPTASLDSQRGRQVVELLGEQVHNSEKAGILVTHDERLIDLCDRVVRIEDGRIDEIQDVEAEQGHILDGSGSGKNGTSDEKEPSLIGKLLHR
jgi:putative ABC transport system ATP-binding protein